jgi:hypothetical protein
MQGKEYKYVSKTFEIRGETPAHVAAIFLERESIVPKVIVRKGSKYFTASTRGKIPSGYEFMGVFNCNMPYRDLVRELAA